MTLRVVTTITTRGHVTARAGNEPSQRMKFHNHRETHVKALVGGFNKEKVLVGAIPVIVKLESSRRFFSSSKMCFV